MITKDVIKFVQQQLIELGHYQGLVDGLYGVKTLQALENISDIPGSYSKRRKLVAFIQRTASKKDIETGPIDGYWGPQTQYAYEQLQHLIREGEPEVPWRPEGLAGLNPNQWPSQTTDQQLIDYYGQVGENQTTLELPYPHRLSWETSKVLTRIQCHSKVHDSLGRILSNVLARYGHEGIRELRLDNWGGCFNVRKMRGGTCYSTHSWGIAMDYDPNRNKLRWGRDRAHFARPDYDEWWQCWEAEGWVSLGRSRNFDWMHVQAAKL